MIERLTCDGDLDESWQPVWEQMPRHLFAPDDLWTGEIALSRRTDPHGWADAVYSETPLINGGDDDATGVGGSAGMPAASWMPSPSAVARLLQAACIGPGRHILQIGTGSGWATALMAAYAPGITVISLEADPAVAAKARQRLASAGFGPPTGVSVLPADGSGGYRPAAPYQRVIATAAVHRIPQAWIDQTEVGALIVTPWRTRLLDGLLLVLESNGNGMAGGGFVDSLPSAASPVSRRSTHEVPMLGGAVRHTRLHPGDVFDGQGAHLAAALLVPDTDMWTQPVPHRHIRRLEDPKSGSWAAAEFPAGGDRGRYEVRQGGPRRLWDEVEAAYKWSRSRDCPEYPRFGMTVSRYGQSVWLDDPTNVVSQDPPSRS